jgi:hypothetical protein
MGAGASWYKPALNETVRGKCNYRIVLQAADLSISGTHARLVLRGKASGSYILSGCSIGPRSGSTENFSSTPTRVTFGGSNSVTIAAGTYTFSDWIPFTLNEAADYLIHFAFVTSDANNMNYEAGGYEYYKASADDDTMVENPSGYSGEPYTVLLTELHVKDTEGLVWAKYLPSISTGLNNYNERVIVPSNEIVASGNRVRVAFKANSSHSLTIDGASIGPRDGYSSAFAANPIRLLFSGNNGITIPAGEVAWSDWTALYDFDSAKDHLIHFKSSQGAGTNYFQYCAQCSYAHEYYKFTDDDDVMVLSPIGYNPELSVVSLYLIEADNGASQVPDPPDNVQAAPGDEENIISWDPSEGATSYNLYWDTETGVTKETGTKIEEVTSPHVHSGRDNGQPYYYVVTAENEEGESDESDEVSATPEEGGGGAVNSGSMFLVF